MKASIKTSITAGRALTVTLLLFLTGALLAAMAVPADARPRIMRCDANYGAGTLTVNCQWQSENPVVMVRITAGSEQKEIPVSEFENTRTPRGFRGDTSAGIPVENPGDAISYFVTLEDDIHVKSEPFVGKVTTGKKADSGTPPPPSGGGIRVGDKTYGARSSTTPGKGDTNPPADPGEQQAQKDLYDKVNEQMGKMDMPPTLRSLSVSIDKESNAVVLSAQARDDKGLREISYVITDASGSSVMSEQASITAEAETKDYTGKFATITTLPAGSYTVTANAVDQSGNASQKVSRTFTVTAAKVQVLVRIEPAEAAKKAKFTIDNGQPIGVETQDETEYSKTWLVDPDIEHTIKFSSVTKYKTPKPQTFKIPAGTEDAHEINATYDSTK
jgi:hypothetical protein